MKQLFLIALVVVSLSSVLALPALSDTPDTPLDTKVTPLLVSATIHGGPVDFGTVGLSTSDADRSTVEAGPVTVENTGSVNTDFQINASDATSSVGGNTDWTLNCASPNGVVAANEFVYKFGVSSFPASFDFDAAGETLCPVGGTARNAGSAIAPGGTKDIVLQIAMPTSSTGYAERTSQIIITALQSP